MTEGPSSFIAAKDFLWLVYLYPIRFAARLLPVSAFLFVIRFADPVCQLLTRTQKSRIRRHFDAAKRAHNLRQPSGPLARAVISRILRRTADDLILDKLTAQEMNCRRLTGLEILKDSLAKGRGVLVVGGHFYANRLASRHLELLGCPMMSVRNRRPPDALMGRLGKRFLHQRYIEFLHGVIRDEVFVQDPECTLKIFKRLRGGGIVHIYLDAGVTALRTHGPGREPVWLPFLGTQRPFPTGLLQLARLSGCAVVPMLCLGDSDGFSIEFGEPAPLNRDVAPEAFAAANLPELIAGLETTILANPDQWELWGIIEQAVFLS
jgi:lauroyl/myristoyl acyltransferase